MREIDRQAEGGRNESAVIESLKINLQHYLTA